MDGFHLLQDELTIPEIVSCSLGNWRVHVAAEVAGPRRRRRQILEIAQGAAEAPKY